MNKIILQNEAQCLNCNDIIWSGSRHDFKSCKCGNICVDGGMEYIRRVYSSNDAVGLMRDRSLTVSDGDAFKRLVKTVEFFTHNRVDDDVIMLLVCLAYHKDRDRYRPKYQPEEFVDDVLEEIDTMKDTGRNALGITLGVIRVLRRHKLLDPELFEEPAETVNPETAAS